RLEQELQDGAERRLARVAELVTGPGPPLDGLPARVEDARNVLRELARGIHPAALSRGGLDAALHELAGRSPVPVAVTAPAERFPPAVETAVYFICAEALANVAKYAEASRVRIRVANSNSRLEVEVVDNGIGGADPAAGSGLRGLTDRVEALDGRLIV